MALGEERHRDTKGAQQNYVVHADADQTRIVQCWNGNLAGFKSKEQSKDEQKAVEGVKHDYPHGKMRANTLLAAENCLVITVVGNL